MAEYGLPISHKTKQLNYGRSSDSALKVTASATLYDYVNLEDLIAEVVCELCHMPFVDPREMPCCNKLYCCDCLDVYAKNKCPNDREAFESADSLPRFKDRFLTPRLDGLEVMCRYHTSGECEWVGPRANLDEHLSRTCTHTPCPQQGRGCDWRGHAQAVEQHIDEDCAWADISCPNDGCQHTGPRQDVLESHATDPEQCVAVRQRLEQEAAEAAARREAARQERLERLKEARESLVQTLNPPEEEMVKICVSGHEEVVEQSTLLKYDDSVLAQMFAPGKQLQRTSGGSVVLAIDAGAFKRIVLWLRTGAPPHCDTLEQESVLMHYARVFALGSLVEALGGEVDEDDEDGDEDSDGFDGDVDSNGDEGRVKGEAGASPAAKKDASASRKKNHRGPRITQARLLQCMQVSNCAGGGRLALPGADLSGLYMAGAGLQKSLLRGCDMRGVNAAAVDLRNSDLSDVNLSGATLQEANLSGCNLTGADLSNCDLSNCNLKGATVTAAQLLSANSFSGADLSGQDFSGADLSNCDLTNCNLKGATVTAAQLVSASSLSGANLSGQDFSGQDFSGADLSKCDLTNCDLSKCDLSKCNLGNCDLKGAIVTMAQLQVASGLDGLEIPDSAILTNYSHALSDWLPEWHPSSSLLYRGSRDGFTAAQFHAKCDGKGSTVVLVRCTGGHIFGGVAKVAWASSSTAYYAPNPSGFLFTLTNPHNIPPTKYLHNGANNHGMLNNADYGPTFGGGHDLHISDNCNGSGSYCNLGNAYTDTTGQGANTFTGAQRFVVAEIEVFQC